MLFIHKEVGDVMAWSSEMRSRGSSSRQLTNMPSSAMAARVRGMMCVLGFMMGVVLGEMLELNAKP